VSVLCLGDYGIGKSAAVFEAGKLESVEVRDVRLAGKEPGDLVGLSEIEDNGDRHTVNRMPKWFPTNPEWKGFVFFDELNRAHRDVINGIFQAVYDRELHGHKFPNKAKIVVCANFGTDYDVNEFDPALRDRFAVVALAPSVEEWLTWAKGSGIHPSVIGFIGENRNLLDGVMRDTEGKNIKKAQVFKTPSRRSWARLSNLINANEDWQDLSFAYAGACCGVEVGHLFQKFVQEKYKIITGKDILVNYDKVVGLLDKDNLSQLATVAEATAEYMGGLKKLSEKHIENIKKFLVFLPAEPFKKFYDDCGLIEIFQDYFASLTEKWHDNKTDEEENKICHKIYELIAIQDSTQTP